MVASRATSTWSKKIRRWGQHRCGHGPELPMWLSLFNSKDTIWQMSQGEQLGVEMKSSMSMWTRAAKWAVIQWWSINDQTKHTKHDQSWSVNPRLVGRYFGHRSESKSRLPLYPVLGKPLMDGAAAGVIQSSPRTATRLLERRGAECVQALDCVLNLSKCLPIMAIKQCVIFWSTSRFEVVSMIFSILLLPNTHRRLRSSWPCPHPSWKGIRCPLNDLLNHPKPTRKDFETLV